jgi:hypothetical protein
LCNFAVDAFRYTFVVAQDTVPVCSRHKEFEEMIMGFEYENNA